MKSAISLHFPCMPLGEYHPCHSHRLWACFVLDTSIQRLEGTPLLAHSCGPDDRQSLLPVS